MKLAYVTIFDPSNISAWSGTGVYIRSALQDVGFQIETIGSLKHQWHYFFRVKEVLYTKAFAKTYYRTWDPLLLKGFAAQVERGVAAIDPDVVFSLWTNPIAYLRTDKPIIFWGDATFAGLVASYPDFQNLCAETIKDGHKTEQLALSRCRLAIYSSEWAANTAIHNYDVDPAKVKVVPFGPNISCKRTIQDMQLMMKDRDFDVCRLLFVGVEWGRKGGDMAVQVAGELNRRGIPTELHIVGCNPPGEVPGFVKQHGFVSKASDAGRELLDGLFSRSHFLIVPSRAEAYGIVFAEASSFGLPSLATNVGGIPTVVRDGKNGFTYPLDASPAAYCDTIESVWSSRQQYERLALSSFAEYSERLNWEAAGRQVRQLIHEACR